MFMQKLRKDKRGLSLIELVCAMAILSIITLTISGAMVFASNSYRQGSADTALQQEVQFTVNAIESLIVDATNEVVFDGTTLKITNVDYTYEIVHDAAAKTLCYTQLDTVSGDVLANNELLAKNIEEFKVDTSNYDTARNVVIDIAMKSGDSEFSDRYNITSRNDVSAGEKPEIVVQINCESDIVVEPLQTYFLGVNVIGPASSDYTVSLVGNTTTTTKAEKVSGGINVTLGAPETGGASGVFKLLITSTVLDSSGNPFQKWVNVHVRRVNSVSIIDQNSVGTAYKAGTVYTATATAAGTALTPFDGMPSDSDPYAYINPDTYEWTFEVSEGTWEDWFTLGPNGSNKKEIQITLKKDMKVGDWIKLTAFCQHPEGVLKDGSWTNKASRASNAVARYDTKKDEWEIKPTVSVGESDFLRGDDFDITIPRDLDAMVKENWESNPDNDGKTFDPNKDGYNAGYTGNHHIRYISEDGLDKSVNYSQWKRLSYQGSDVTKVEFKAADLDDMKYMKRYKLELVYSFKYQNKNNETCVYPYGFDPSNPDVDPKYIHTWIIDPIEIHFGKAQMDGDAVIDLETQGYLNTNQSGIGTATNPLKVKKGNDLRITYTTVGPGSNWKAGVNNLLDAMTQCWESSDGGATWTKYGSLIDFDNEFNNDPKRQTGTIRMKLQNCNFETAEKGKVYKFVLGREDASGKGGQVYTDKTGYEQYSLDNPTGDAGRGLIYVQFE